MKFEEIYEKIWEEIIQNEVSLGGSPTIYVTLVQILNKLKLLETGACQSAVNGKDNVGWKLGLKENIGSSALSGSCWITKVGQSFDSWASPVAEKTCPRYQRSADSLFSAECLIKKISLLVPTNNNNIDSFGTNISLFSWAVGRWVGGNSLEGGSSCGFLS